jgi:subtilase family serine protease
MRLDCTRMHESGGVALHPRVAGFFASRIWRVHVGLLLVLALILPSFDGAAAAQQPMTTMAGHVLKMLPSSTRLNKVESQRPITVIIALRPRSQAEFQAAGDYRANSSPRRTRPTPSEIGSNYGQGDESIKALSQYFAHYGLTSDAPTSDHLSFEVRGTVGQVEQALAVDINDYQDQQGRRFFATAVDPRLPVTLAGSVQAVLGLDNYPWLKPSHTGANPAAGGYYAPQDVWTAYDFNPLYSRGLTGAGQTIGIIGCDSFSLSDISHFEGQFGLPASSISDVIVDGGSPGSSPETTLDIEWSSAIAKGAAIRVYSAPCLTFAGLYAAVSAAANENIASVLSISLGGCEAGVYNAGYLLSMENEFYAAALLGQGIFVASGDRGAYECQDTFGNPTLGVSYPASDANVTAVGETTLYLNPNSTYGSELAWGSTLGLCAAVGTPSGGGGGLSSFISEPPWESSVNSSGFRGLPDISYDGDCTTGFYIYYGGQLLSGIGGTSIGTPQWAGLAAIANQAAGGRFGLLAPWLYSPAVLNTRFSPNPPYHDVTCCANTVTWSPGVGWDYATGWGSPDASNLVSALVQAVTTPTPTPTATLRPTITPSETPSPTITWTSTATQSPTITRTPTATASPTSTPTPTLPPVCTPSVARPTSSFLVYLPLVTNDAALSLPTSTPPPDECITATPSSTLTPTSAATMTSTATPSVTAS